MAFTSVKRAKVSPASSKNLNDAFIRASDEGDDGDRGDDDAGALKPTLRRREDERPHPTSKRDKDHDLRR